MNGKKSCTSINSIGHFRHVTLVFTALLLIVSNDCARSEKVDLKNSCMRYPLQTMCRGSVMKRGIPKLHTLDMIFDNYLRSKLSRTPIPWEEYPHHKGSSLSKFTKRDRSNLYEYMPNLQQQCNSNNNKLKLLDRLFRSELSDGIETGGRYARNTDLRNANANDPDFISFLDNEYQ